jgi:hypothetical protein
MSNSFKKLMTYGMSLQQEAKPKKLKRQMRKSSNSKALIQ